MERLFTALEIPRDIADHLALLQSGLENARWVDPGSFHLTLRFIGGVEPADAQALHEALSMVSSEKFTLRLEGVGHFGGRRPRAVWVGIRSDPALSALQEAHERACRKAGCAVETRKFTPHVTLGRLRGTRRDQVELFRSMNNLFSAGPIAVDRFVLMSSKPSRGGGPYVTQQIYPLT